MLARARVVMVALFSLWVGLDPNQPARASAWALPVLVGYALCAVVLLDIARRSWWWDHRLAGPACVIDGIMFVAGLYATDAVTHDLFSVFMTFFAFMVLGAATRWNTKATVTVAAALVAGFALVGAALHGGSLSVDWPHFLRREGYLVLLALLFIWFVRIRPWGAIPRLKPGWSEDGRDPLEAALAYGMTAYTASTGAVLWLESGCIAPRVVTAGLEPGSCGGLSGGGAPFLFDQPRRRRLTLDQGGRLKGARPRTADSGLPVNEGLAIPLRGRTGRGELILGGIPQLCFEDLITAEAIADEIGRAIDDDAAQAIARELAMSRLRSQLAADLHDGVAQTLAGVQFRLQAVKARTVAQTATPEDIDRISEGIAAEQNHIRTMIERLRRGTIEPGERDLRQELLPLVETLAMQWGVAIALDEAGERVPLAVAQVYEVQQVVREAVANAVRHGRATQIELTLAARSPRGFMLGIRDNGAGCAAQAQPRSIAARVSTLRGTLVFSSQAGNTRLSIVVPETTA